MKPSSVCSIQVLDSTTYPQLQSSSSRRDNHKYKKHFMFGKQGDNLLSEHTLFHLNQFAVAVVGYICAEFVSRRFFI